MSQEELINKLVEDIYSIEIETYNYGSSITSRLKDFEDNTNDLNKVVDGPMKSNKKPIEDVVKSLAEQFDLSNAKTYLAIKEIALAQVLSRELYKKARLDLRSEKKKSGANTTFFSEYRKMTQHILKLLKDVYVSPESKEIKVPDRDVLFGSDKWIK